MKKVLFCSLALATFFSVTAQTTKTPAKPAAAKSPLKNLLDSFSYAAGLNVANNMKSQGITSLNAAMMAKALTDVYGNKTPLLTEEMANVSLQNQLQIFAQKKMSAEKAKGIAFMEANKKRKEVTTLPNGLQYEVLKKSELATPNKPKLTDSVLVHYAGTLVDGTEFDNSFKRGQPYLTSLHDVIKGWTEILQLMSVGDRWKVYIPSALGYGDAGRGQAIPPGAVLVFEMSLEGIKPGLPQ